MYNIFMEFLIVIIIVISIIQFFSFQKIRKNILHLNNRIDQLEFTIVKGKESEQESVELQNTEFSEKARSIELQVKEDSENYSEPEINLPKESSSQQKKNNKRKFIILFKKFEHVFIESWIAIIAVIILVTGISFFGIWASTRISPILRFWMIVGASIVLGGLSFFAGKYERFQPLGVWIRSAGAAVYLFAALGAGGIPGIQWIESPLMGLIMLVSGIAVNIILAFIGKKQIFSSLHIILSIVAISIAPQSVVTLIVATVITFSGIAISFKKRWDIHHLISILFYFGFIIYWGFQVDSSNSFYNISAVSVIIVTALVTLFMHYRRIYADSEFEVTPLIVHLVNWLFLSVGLIKYSPESDYIFIPLFIAGISLFFLAGRAKKLKIKWLFATDTLISQLMVLLALVSLINFDLSNFMIIFLILIESLGFLVIIWREKEALVHTIAFTVSSISGFALLVNGLDQFMGNSSDNFWVFPALFALSATAMSAWLLHISKREIESILSGGKLKRKFLTVLHKLNVIAQGVLIPLFVLGIYLLILSNYSKSAYFGPDIFTVPLFIALLAVKFRLNNWGMRIGIALYIFIETIIAILFLAFELDSSYLAIGLYSLPLYLMSLSVLIYSLKKRGGVHERIPGIYLLTLHLIVSTFFIFTDISSLLSGLSWLVLAIIYLGLSNTLKAGRLTESMVDRLKKGLINGGYLFLLGFVLRFLIFDIYEDTMILVTIRAEYLVEIAAVIIMGLWFYLNKSKRLVDLLFLEIILTFIIILLFIEVSVTILPAVFIGISIFLLIIGMVFNKSLSRLRIVSVLPAWISAFLVAFVTSPYLNLSIKYTDLPWIMSVIGIILQFIYLGLFYFSHKSDEIRLPAKLLGMEQVINKLLVGKNIFLYYPVFASVLFFLIWSFSGAVLTALISFEALLILVLSLVVKENSFRYTALIGILVSVIRLVLFDLRESDIFIKAIAFILVSVVMLLMNVLYNKFKDRIENEKN
jgi:hypothetical protein